MNLARLVERALSATPLRSLKRAHTTKARGRPFKTIIAAAALLVASAFGQAAFAQTVISITDSGWYDEPGNHDAINANYFTGTTGTARGELRSWFVFDLTAVTDDITAAEIHAFSYTVRFGPNTIQLNEVTTPVTTLMAASVDENTIWDDLGDGVIYGSAIIENSDEFQTFTLNASGIAALNAARGGLFAVAFENLTTEESYDGAFSGSDFNSGNEIVLTTVPADVTAPTVTSITRQTPAAASTNADTLTFRVTFSEPVTNVDSTDFTASGTTATPTGVATVSSAIYDVTVSGGDLAGLNATVGLGFAGGQDIEDLAGAPNPLTNTTPTGANQTYDVDNAAPSVAIAGPAGPVNGIFAVSFTFSESVTGFVAGDVTVGNGSISNFAGAGAAYTADITPSSDGAVTVDVAATVASDAAGNANTAAPQYSVTADLTDPTVTIAGPAGPVAGLFSVSFTFSESVLLFEDTDVVVGNGTISNFAGAGANYTADITPTADGTVTVDVPAAVAVDVGANPNSAAAQYAVEADLTAPTVAIAGPAGPVMGLFSVSFTFSEDVTGFVDSDVVVANGALSNFAGSGANYTADITPAADGLVTVDVAGAVAIDSAGNDNTAATQYSVTADITAPTVIIAGPAGPVTGIFAVSFTFSEPVTGLSGFPEDGDISVGNGSLSNFAGSGANYTADITPAGDGTVTVDVDADSAFDTASNGNTAATQYSVTADITEPTVTIAGPAGPVTGLFAVSFTFSESVTGFDSGDVVVGNGTLSNFAGSGAAYTADVTPAADGAVTVDVAAAVAIDGAGNDNQAASQYTVQADITAPSVTISGPAGVQAGPFTVTFTFSEDVTGFALGDISVGNGAASDFATVTAAEYTATITPASDGVVTVDVAAAAAEDLAGNDTTEATQYSVTANVDAPTLVSVTPNPATVEDSDAGAGGFTMDILFSEPMNTGVAPTIDFPAEDPTATLAFSSGSWSGDMLTYTATFDVTDADDVIPDIDVDVSAAQDAAANVMAATTTADVFAIDMPDVIAPTVVSVTPTPATIENGDEGPGAFSLAVLFSEPMDTAVDPTIAFPTENPSGTLTFASGSWSVDGLTYTATYDVADSDETLADIDVEVSGAQDATGNALGAAATTANVFSITMPPPPGPSRITIQATTSPSIAGDGTFTFASADIGAGDIVLATASGTATSDAFTRAPGTYVVSQSAPEGWRLDSISCTGDVDTGSTVDVSSSTVSIDLDVEEQIVCTFANVRDEEYVRRVTGIVIRSFMTQRADQILSSSPSLVNRIRNGGGGSGGMAGNGSEGRTAFTFSGSLSDLRRANNGGRTQIASQGGVEGLGTADNPRGDEWPARFDIWISGSYSSISDDRAGLADDSDFTIVHFGADYRVTPDILLGAIVQYDHMSTTGGTFGSSVEGDGWMAGPYVAARIVDNLYVDVRAAWGRSTNDVDPFGLYTDEFETERWLFEANLTGDLWAGGLRVSPSLGFAYFDEEQEAYVDSLSISIPSQNINIGRMTVGPEFAYRIDRGDGAYVEPFAELTAIWDYDGEDVLAPFGGSDRSNDIRGSARFGLSTRFRNGGILTGAVRVDGLADENYEATAGEILIRLPL